MPRSWFAPLLCLGAALAQTPLRLEVVATGLTQPVFATAPSGDFDRLFVVEQPGRIRIVRNGTLLPTPFLNLVGTGTVSFGGEMGLLGLAFHPRYAQNGQFFVFHTTHPFVNATLRRFTVSATNPDVADPASATTLLTVPMIYGNHNGGFLAFGPDGYLYLGIGDGGSNAPNWPNDPQNHAQRGDSLLGKLLRLDVDRPAAPLQYGIPPGNPYAGPGDPRDEIWAFGVRNPWRGSFDRLTGDLWLGDVGGNREEIDFQAAGAGGGQNYGWSCMSGTVCTGAPVCTCFAPTLTGPIHQYTAATSRAVIGGFVYRGARIPDLRGTYFYADYSMSQIWSFRRNGSGITQLTNRTAELVPPPPYFVDSISSFGEDGRGELYVLSLNGEVFRIAPQTPVLTGLTPYGTGVPGCSGAHVLDAATSPVLGNLAFELRGSQGPANGFGFVVIAGAPDVAGSDPFGLGVPLHVALQSWVLVAQLAPTDAQGLLRLGLPIPGVMSLAGLGLYAQMAHLWTPQVCTPSPSLWSSSHGLAITIQP